MKKVVMLLILLVSQWSMAQTKSMKELSEELQIIGENDQKDRAQIEYIQSKYGSESAEMKALWKSMRQSDSVNIIKVSAIIDRYGWLGADEIGDAANSTLFLVVQHADLPIQEKYLPIMRKAVKNKKAKGSSLALLEDRVALRQGKRQIYGSQIGWNMKTNNHYVLPLEDPDNVDKRRAQVGLPPLAEYVTYWEMKWDPEQYKKDLPEIEKKK
ncbi:DUF6624 domain-containing protein [Flavobacterium cerinum]|uniref:Uncharacterized protein n=1 Tax=Flavobacterium cerinum TaxID=2502784 RepID=A0ABY5IPX0_9FLAO|nr:DUF6624 domain-containing protein [Flavobacterium cerinum]UUC44895.1 hypothetical protein NOX80_14845 [Flavobacterium cerinum]